MLSNGELWLYEFARIFPLRLTQLITARNAMKPQKSHFDRNVTLLFGNFITKHQHTNLF